MGTQPSHKFHINKHNKVAPCGATKRACRYKGFPVNESEPTSTSQVPAVETAAAPATQLRNPPSYPSLEEGKGFDLEYSESFDDYGVLRIWNESLTRVNLRALLADIHNVSEEDAIPDELVQFAKDEGWDDVDRFEVEVDRVDDDEHMYASSYERLYDKITINPKDGQQFYAFLDKLSSRHWSAANAKDSHGILDYVRGKGFDTTGLSPIEAVKAQLAAENPGRRSDLLEGTREITTHAFNLDSIHIPNQAHYDAAEPRPQQAPRGEHKVAGILVRHGDRYSLVDGYHRVKHLRQLQEEKRTRLGRRVRHSGYFIVLSP